MKPSAIFPLPGESLAEKRRRQQAEHTLATSRLYIDAFERMMKRFGRPTCELHKKPSTKLELHHVEGGIGRRRERQCLANVALACECCHELAKKNAPRYFALLRAFILHYQYPEPPCLRRRS